MDKKIITGIEREFSDNDFIISITDPKGIIQYANDIFVDISGYNISEIIGKPHNILRHPHMPRCIFKLLWQRLKQGEEIIAYTVNRCKNGDHYWVQAHVTPTISDGKIINYFSSRRNISPETKKTISEIYKDLLLQEQNYKNSNDGMNASFEYFFNLLQKRGLSYDEFVSSI